MRTRHTVAKGEPADEYGYTSFENIRVATTGTTHLVSWEAQSQFDIGDSWQAANYALFDGQRWESVELAAMAYAFATYGLIAPTRRGQELGSVVWGVANSRAVELLPQKPSFEEIMGGLMPARPLRSIPTDMRVLNRMVVDGEVAAATTYEGCDGTDCEFDGEGVVAFGLGARAFTTVLEKSKRAEFATLSHPLAIASLRQGTAVSYRGEGALSLAWLDPNGKALGAPIRVSNHPLESVALAVSNDTLVLLWAEREDDQRPYTLKLATAAFGAAPQAIQTLSSPQSAQAPSLLAAGDTLSIAWMAGDDKSGVIKMTQTSLAAPSLARALTMSNDDEPNAREPKLAGSPSAPLLVYKSVGAQHPGGSIQLATLACPAATAR